MKDESKERFREIEPEEYRAVGMGPPPGPAGNACRTVILAVLSSALVTAGMLAIYDNYFAQKIVALDVKGYIAEQRDLYLGGKINDAQLRESFDRLEKVRERVPKNRVIILGDVLVRKNVEEIRP